jgi:hypothetical protein
MKKTKKFKPYTGDKCTITKTGAGVYIIYKNNQPAYVGFSASNVKKTMYRHFQSWNDPTQRRVVYKHLHNIECRVIFTTSKRAAILEEALILKLLPTDNSQKIEMYSKKDKEGLLYEFVQMPEEAPF